MDTLDVAVIGAGAAGLATAIFAARAAPGLRIVAFDGARAPGAKILVSGGSRCNVTNAIVTESDFNGGRPAVIRRVIRALPVPQTIGFFDGLGVRLHEEAGGKLFPDGNKSRDVLNGLLAGLDAAGATLRPAHRVLSVMRRDDGFEIETSQGAFRATSVVLATGGLSLPKTGSDGAGYALAERLGHGLVPTTPALAPLLFTGSSAGHWHTSLSGVAQPARLTLRVDGAARVGIAGALLWTHFGISGPAALDMSRHWLRARLEGRSASLAVNLVPEERFEHIETRWKELARLKPRATLHSAVAEWLPASVAATLLAHAGVPGTRIFADLTKGDRRLVIHLLLDWTLPAGDSRGYAYAEATAGGVPLQEIDPGTMESRRCPGLYLVGEILDVDGRLGGFNFQWAWSSAKVAGDALARRGRAVSL